MLLERDLFENWLAGWCTRYGTTRGIGHLLVYGDPAPPLSDVAEAVRAAVTRFFEVRRELAPDLRHTLPPEGVMEVEAPMQPGITPLLRAVRRSENRSETLPHKGWEAEEALNEALGDPRRIWVIGPVDGMIGGRSRDCVMMQNVFDGLFNRGASRLVLVGGPKTLAAAEQNPHFANRHWGVDWQARYATPSKAQPVATGSAAGSPQNAP